MVIIKRSTPPAEVSRSTDTKSNFVVLVVDDEPLIRLLMVESLADDGYVVCEACTADEAIQQLSTRTDIRAVVTDIEMPGSMDGLMLARLIRTRFPDIAIFVGSGASIPCANDLPQGAIFMPKPWRQGWLIGQLRRLATGGRGSMTSHT